MSKDENTPTDMTFGEEKKPSRGSRKKALPAEQQNVEGEQTPSPEPTPEEQAPPADEATAPEKKPKREKKPKTPVEMKPAKVLHGYDISLAIRVKPDEGGDGISTTITLPGVKSQYAKYHPELLREALVLADEKLKAELKEEETQRQLPL